jgi:hypothetical protein
MEDGSKAAAGLGTLRAVLAILQWWGFNVTVIIMNKWIFQVSSVPSILILHPSIHPSIHPLPRIWMPNAPNPKARFEWSWGPILVRNLRPLQ